LKFRQQEFMKLIRSKRVGDSATAVDRATAANVIAKGIRRLLFQQSEWRNPEFTARNLVREEMTGEMMSRFAQSMSAEQKAHFKKRLRGFAEDVSALMASDAG
jgi:hypothetical protein